MKGFKIYVVEGLFVSPHPEGTFRAVRREMACREPATALKVVRGEAKANGMTLEEETISIK